MGDSVLLIGGGGREHAIAWKLSQSPKIDHIYVAPGNAGTESSTKMSNCNINVNNYAEVSQFCQAKNISLVVVGPEDPLANGISDHLAQDKILCFGPSKKAAQIEASKEFAKEFMDKHQIPTARWKSFTNADEAKDHILNAPYKALVVKASGLAAGKGVIVASCKEEAVKAVDSLKEDKGLSSASETIIIEEQLDGEEVSVLCFSDGNTISVMPPAQDHKRLLDNDEGPNTGGMGAYCRCPLVNADELESIKTDILEKAIKGMEKDGMPFVGVLYAGLMMTLSGPKVLEFNCRFGDPETQVLLPLLVSDLYDVMLACVKGTLGNMAVEWSPYKQTVGIVLVSGGYPGSYPKGKTIEGLCCEEMTTKYLVFHAGTAKRSDKVVTSGGRVLTVVAVGVTIQEAAHLALDGCRVIHFEGQYYRSDIAKKAFRRNQHFEGVTYKSAGVDIDSADDLVRKIKVLTKETVRPEVCGGIGGFGGIFELSNYDNPYLVAKVSNIGDKLKVAQVCSRYESAGYDLVSLAVNEVLCLGAEPLFFLDTFTCGKLNTKVAAEVITGIAKGCKDSHCTLIGGETAEMPGMYADGDFDLTAFARGAVEKSLMLPRKADMCEGDVVIGLHSSSHSSKAISISKNLIHMLGLTYSDIAPFDNSHTLADVLLTPNVIYVQNLIPLLKKGSIKGMAYLLKDGLAESVGRILPDDYNMNLDMKNLTIPLYDWLNKYMNFSEEEMKQYFNFGIDILLIVDQRKGEDVYQYLEQFYGGKVSFVGNINKKSIEENKIQLKNLPFKQQSAVSKKRVAIFTSDKGTNMQALINYANSPTTVSYDIALVLSLTNCENITKAKETNIPAKVIDCTGLESPADLDSTINKVVKSFNIDVICLDEFRKEFSSSFLNVWKGKVLNIHSSLLPSFDCSDPISEALLFGARITGCTVYLVDENGKFGKILKQSAVKIEPHATQESLCKNIHRLQQLIYPKVVDLFLSNKKNEDVTSKIYATGLEISNKKFHNSVKSLMKSTHRLGFDENSDSGLFDLKASGYHSCPYLVSGTDGVGTKLKIAQVCDKHDTIGIDLVAMCVNDILTHGAEPLLFMQSFDCGILNPDLALNVISGIAEGCKQANCALIESEISELPDIYFNSNQCIQNNENYDVVGYAEGALIKEYLLPRSKDIKEGDIVIGVASSGIHSNGYSLVRKIVELKNYSYNDSFPLDKSMTIGEALLTPTKIYVKSLLPLMRQNLLKAAAHITGGGLTENIPRVLPSQVKVVLDGDSWEMPPVLQWIAHEGQMSEKEMLKTFNCGIGMALILEKNHENEVLQALRNSGEKAFTIGCVKHLTEGEDKVEVNKFKLSSNLSTVDEMRKKRVGVLISGSGTNLQALIDHTKNPFNRSQAEIVVVISNVPGVTGLKRAQNALIPTKVLSHKGFKKRVEFDMAVHSLLKEAEVEIVCLAGFMRILSKEFVQLWQGKLLNVHPAILPAFKGVGAHKQALEAGVKITGCTVHFVEAEVDAGAVIEQAAINIDEKDNEETLQEKVKILEHTIFPIALELLASDRVSRSQEGKLLRNF